MAMEGGVGDSSYFRNSNGQADIFKLHLAPEISKAIQKNFDIFAQTKKVRIADIGCSSGTNTISSVSFIIDEIKKRLTKPEHDSTVFEVLFSDLPTNDFNTLFKLLDAQGKGYYYSAVPGSFAERLFPDSSLHFVVSNLVLHWLSKVPSVLTERILVDNHANADAIAAYSKQAQEDLCSFLKHRAGEFAKGGLLSCCFWGSESFKLPWIQGFQSAWEDLVKEGHISQECFLSFTVGVYMRSLDEVQNAIQETKCFKVIQLEQRPFKFVNVSADTLAKGWKAVTRRSVSEHLKGDKNLVELLYKKTEAKIRSLWESDCDIAAVGLITFVLQRV